MVGINELAELTLKRGGKQMSGHYILELVYYPSGSLSVGGKFYTCLEEKDLVKKKEE